MKCAAGRAILLVCLGVSALAATQRIIPGEVKISSRPFVPQAGVIRAQTTLVEVDAVVRDEDGRVVPGLKASDFVIIDDGKPQSISAFSVQILSPAAPGPPQPAPSVPTNVSVEPAPAPAQPARNAVRFVAFFFDDLHTEKGDIDHARTAALGFLKRGFTSGDHVGVFTSSGSVTLDFTEKRDTLAAALGKIEPRLRMSPNGFPGCPQISPYAAYGISTGIDPGAFDLAVTQAIDCNCGSADDSCRRMQKMQVQVQADQTWELARQQSLITLDTLDAVVHRIASLQGQRSVLLASSGFPTGTLEQEWDRILSEAVHSGIVINSLDAKGLYAEGPGGTAKDPENFAGASYIGTYNSLTRGARLEEQVAAMALLAEGTGGRFFRNNNDLTRGFRDLAAAPEVAYLLAFSPDKAKLDGRFHDLKVEVEAKGHYQVEARRGYYARKGGVEEPSPEQMVEREVYASDKLEGIPVSVSLQPGKSKSGGSLLWVALHVDPSHFKFQHKQGRNIEQLNFVSALFDARGNLVVGKQVEMDLALTDSTLQFLSAKGINAKLFLDAPPGTYRLREVVQEAIEDKIAALTVPVEVR